MKNKLVEYEIKETIPGIFMVIVPDNYQRAMLFLRCQEHYESHFLGFRGKHFDIFEYMEMYRKWKEVDVFTYTIDWSGYNVPGHIVENCIDHVLDARNGLLPTQYDYIMNSVIDQIKAKIRKNKRWYLIGIDKEGGNVMDHEICHGLFYVDSEYNKTVSSMVDVIPDKIKENISSILLKMGYCEDVIVDEIQAYLSTGLIKEMNKIRGIKKYHKEFREHLKGYLKQRPTKKA
jgi:hypothetical protein